MNIKELKRDEMAEILDFYYHIDDFGHVFELNAEKLDKPFVKIMEGISEIRQMMEDSWDM